MDFKVKWVVVNTPASNKAADRFKAKFPHAAFYGSATLNSKRKSYLLTPEEFEREKDLLKTLRITKARHQPFKHIA